MKRKHEETVYNSFEQFKSELFPELINQEKIDQVKQDTEQFGTCLANKAIDHMLSSTQC